MMQRSGRADLHMHTTASDGLATVHQLLDHITQHTALDVIAITDHDCLDASLWAYYHQDRYPFEIVPGVEVTSADGHILALWVTEPIPKQLSLAETAAAIHEQGGLAIVAHPMEPTIAPHMVRRYLLHPEVLIQSGIDAVEIFNAGAITPGNRWLAKKLFGNLGLPVIGSSDAHLPESVASAVTRFKGITAADLRDSLAFGTTAAEGKSWSIITYLKLLPIEIHKRRNGSLAANPASARPILR
ncbi:MAG: phosphotransferase [Chloroflexi bacterium]|nr:phosphotransferase [Chloroflexota bacterium]